MSAQLAPPPVTPGALGNQFPPRGTAWARAFFGIWFLSISLLGAYWSAGRGGFGFASPRLGAEVTAAAREARYYLGADCGLSASAASDLVRRGPLSALHEQVILTAELPELAGPLRSAGFSVQPAGAPSGPVPARGPWLQLADARGKILFNGPYHSF